MPGKSLCRQRSCDRAIDLPGLDKTVRAEMARVLAPLAEIVHAYDCDVLLLQRWMGEGMPEAIDLRFADQVVVRRAVR